MLRLPVTPTIQRTPEAQEFIDTMVTKHQFAREDIVSWLSAAEHQESIVKAMSRPRRKRSNPGTNTASTLFQSAELMAVSPLGNKTARHWPMPSVTLVLIRPLSSALSVSKTNYGSNTGSYKVIRRTVDRWRSITTPTQTNANRANASFTSELENLLLLAREPTSRPCRTQRILRRRYGTRPVYAEQLPSLCCRLRPGPVRRYLAQSDRCNCQRRQLFCRARMEAG